MMASSDFKIQTSAVLMLFFSPVSFVCGYTDSHDLVAASKLYTSLGFPFSLLIHLDDPCGLPNWQGVECENGNIIGITLNGANLRGKLNDDLGLFTSIRVIDLSSNHIEGSIPTNLPITLRSFILSSNQLNGSIPDTLSSLNQLINMSLSDNHLTGPIPDAFQQLGGLINLDLSGNSLTDELPSSMGNLLSLTTLYLQNNQLSGTLDVLQNVPLRDLNIENNMFSGPIPEKLLSVPNFRRDGNSFDNTTVSSPPPSYHPLSPSDVFSPQFAPRTYADEPSVSQYPESGSKKKKNRITWIPVGGLLVVGVLALGLCIIISLCCRRRLRKKISERHETGMDSVLTDTHKQDQSLKKPFNLVEKVAAEGRRNNEVSEQEMDHTINMTGLDDAQLPPKAEPFSSLPPERIVVDSMRTHSVAGEDLSKIIDSAKFFTIASLQQYTDSFSQENLIGKGTLGSVYRAQLPNGKMLAVKKLDKAALKHLSDQQFLELVSTISKLHHANIVELIGYCIEHEQHLLVYNYCKNGMLCEALLLDDKINKNLSWNDRMHLALQSAKALEYLHEVCQPPIVHRNFTSANVLLDDDLAIRVSDCGLAPLLSPNSLTELQVAGYGAPELESGSSSCQSDVYSFGVVMLELLTGRKANDRSRPRGEQYLVRWAFSQLHDIDALSSMVDPSLDNAYPTKSLSRLADIISLCIQPEPEFRPPMSEIVQRLLHMIQNDL